jgi:hypothetical protein
LGVGVACVCAVSCVHECARVSIIHTSVGD